MLQVAKTIIRRAHAIEQSTGEDRKMFQQVYVFGVIAGIGMSAQWYGVYKAYKENREAEAELRRSREARKQPPANVHSINERALINATPVPTPAELFTQGLITQEQAEVLEELTDDLLTARLRCEIQKLSTFWENQN